MVIVQCWYVCCTVSRSAAGGKEWGFAAMVNQAYIDRVDLSAHGFYATPEITGTLCANSLMVNSLSAALSFRRTAGLFLCCSASLLLAQLDWLHLIQLASALCQSPWLRVQSDDTMAVVNALLLWFFGGCSALCTMLEQCLIVSMLYKCLVDNS
eukprot:GHRR01010268.1.p2 GENE.GHRR01010268.1~~GHRR01010268.1.p2  ORF type:complete len:154 (+),score=19.78 GHRR01010268.1:447-908(+)